MSGFIGKYVCYGNDAGMFCWGRIKDEAEVNTVDGPKEVFILDQRMSGPHVGMERIRCHKGDTILQKDKIDLEKDVFDRDVREFEAVSNEDLFLIVLNQEAGLKGLKSLGPWNMLKSGMDQRGDFNIASQVLKKRLGVEDDGSGLIPGNMDEEEAR